MALVAGREVFPLCFGANVLGWTADEEQSFEVLDAYVAAGGNFIDNADSYPPRSSGRPSGISEEILGRWMASRGNRDDLVIATKCGNRAGHTGLSAANIRECCEQSLERLQTDRIDLYYAHRDDESTPVDETLGAFDELVREGKVLAIGASNFSPERLAESLETSRRDGLASYSVLSPHYNLVERGYEKDLRPVCERNDVACIPYFSLASGFLTGKFRPGRDEPEGPRSQWTQPYMNERGARVLDALDRVAAARDVPVASVALAWLGAQPTVATTLASARNTEQLEALLPSVGLELSGDELAQLSEASG